MSFFKSQSRFLPLAAALCLAGLSSAGVNAATQTTVVAAPVAAIAIGNTSASVAINPARPGQVGNNTVVVGAPVIAISGIPFVPAHIVIR